MAWARKRPPRPGASKTKGLLIALDERGNAAWLMDPATGNARRSVARRTSGSAERSGAEAGEWKNMPMPVPG